MWISRYIILIFALVNCIQLSGIQGMIDTNKIDHDTLIWQELTEQDGFILDLKYAGHDNFTGQQIYDCPRCFVRPALATILRKLNLHLQTLGYRIVLFDCYRPLGAQEELWKILPNPTYVTSPKKGSMHNRGLAIDMTLADLEGNEVDMGSGYDHFGRESHIDYLDLPGHVKKNRAILFSSMQKAGLSGIRTEWWHYALRGTGAEISDWKWSCQVE